MICTLPELLTQIASIKRRMTIGVTSGCFDIRHPFHDIYLNKCSAMCDYLIVLIDGDVLYEFNKNKTPVFCENDRVYMMNNQKCVDYVAIMNDLSDLKKVLKVSADKHPTVLFRNGLTVYNKRCIEVSGVLTMIIPDVQPHTSSTEVINYIKQFK